MTTDFSHYLPPGVYIEESETPLVAITGVPPTVVALVGPSRGYQTNTEQVALSDDGVVLRRKGIIPNSPSLSVTVTRVDTGAAVDPADYVLTANGDVLLGQDYTVTITRASGATTPADTPVFVTYNYVEPTYFDARAFDNYEDVKDAYGEPLNTTPQGLGDTGYVAVASPLSLAAKIAFENGAGRLVLVPTQPVGGAVTMRSALSAAYAKIATNYDVNVVVPLPVGIADGGDDALNTGIDLRSHVEASSADGFFRVGIVGFDTTVVATPDTLASSLASKRVMLAYGTDRGVLYYNGSTNQTLTLGNLYVAAAYAGRAAAVPVQKSLTKEVIRGFAGIAGTPLSNSVKNSYSEAGVAVVEADRIGRLSVRHGTTTDRTSVNTREMSLVRARDAMVSLIQRGMDDAQLIGDPIDDETPFAIKSVVDGLLNFAQTSRVIVGYTEPKVRQRSSEPSVVEVKFSYRPAYPLNYIVVSFSIDVATGETTDLTAA